MRVPLTLPRHNPGDPAHDSCACTCTIVESGGETSESVDEVTCENGSVIAVRLPTAGIIGISYHWLWFVTPILGAISLLQSLQSTNGFGLYSGSCPSFCPDNRHIFSMGSLGILHA